MNITYAALFAAASASMLDAICPNMAEPVETAKNTWSKKINKNALIINEDKTKEIHL